LLRPRCGRAWFPSVLDPHLPAARMGAAMISGEAIAPARDVEEGQLIAASLAGDDDAFRHLVERHHRMVLNVAFRAFGSMAAAEDCAQDVFIKVHTRLRSYRADTPFIHWLHRVAANTVTDALRRRRADLSLDSLVHEACSESGDPADAAARQEQRMAVRQAIAALPGRLRDAIVLQVFHELSYQEIAQVLEVPIGTVMSRLHNAKRLLRSRLGGYVDEADGAIGANNQ
jgi:RNA polymerase sigma-70 factor (ECF subfamily)